MQSVNIKKIIFFYILINAPVFFFLNGVFWDDWILYNTKSEYIYERFSQGGLPWLGYYHKVLMHDVGPWVYKLLVMFLYFINGLLLSKLLLKNGIAKEISNLIFLVYLTLPLFGARYVASNTQYVLYATMFLIAWLNLRTVYIAAPLFMVSFGMQSLLVMYLLPYLDYLSSIKKEAKKTRRCLWIVIVYTLLPIAFFGIKNVFFRPYGNYEGYLTINPEKVFHSLYRVHEVTIWTIRNISKNISYIEVFLISILLLLMTLKVFTQITKYRAVRTDAVVPRMLWLSVLGIVLSVLPYALVGNELNIYYGFESRNHAVFIFPAATLIGSVIYLICINGKQIAKISVSFFVASCIITQILIYTSYYKDAYKTDAIIKAINNNKEQMANTSIISVDDKIGVPFVEQRKLGVYEYSGIFRLGAARSGFFARDEEYWSSDICNMNFIGSPLYNTQDFVGGGEVARVTLNAKGGYTIPILKLLSYTVELKVEKNLPWCEKKTH